VILNDEKYTQILHKMSLQVGQAIPR